jgi:ATP-dependent Zn protease
MNDPPANDKEREATAYHEAGHAMVAKWLSIPFVSVTVDAKDVSAGHMVLKRGWPFYRPFGEPSPKVRDNVERDVVMSFSGNIAERRFLGVDITAGSEGDFQDVNGYLIAISQSTTVAEAWGIYLWHRADKIVRTPAVWRGIQAIAAALLERGTLMVAEIDEVLRAARGW